MHHWDYTGLGTLFLLERMGWVVDLAEAVQGPSTRGRTRLARVGLV